MRTASDSDASHDDDLPPETSESTIRVSGQGRVRSFGGTTLPPHAPVPDATLDDVEALGDEPTMDVQAAVPTAVPTLRPQPSAAQLRFEAERLGRNERLADRCRGALAARGVLAIDVVGSAGAGKTALIERTLHALRRDLTFHVIVAHPETAHDAERLHATGVPVVQVTVGQCGQLDAGMVLEAVGMLEVSMRGVVLIENAGASGGSRGPALLDVGERLKIGVVAVTEGDDKPLKAPHLFRDASVIVLSKVDLLPHVAFDVEGFIVRARAVNSDVRVLPLSSTTGAGIDAWLALVREELAAVTVEHVDDVIAAAAARVRAAERQGRPRSNPRNAHS